MTRDRATRGQREGSQGEHAVLLSFFFFFLFSVSFLNVLNPRFFAGVRYRGTGDYFRPLFAYFCDLELVS